jgi:carbon storage regulator
MLVIARKVGETIKIADNIEVVVVGVDGGRVRLGIRAPRELRVLRGELEAQVAGSNQSAAVRREAAGPLLSQLAGEARKALKDDKSP